jgi:hypothetical protein
LERLYAARRVQVTMPAYVIFSHFAVSSANAENTTPERPKLGTDRDSRGNREERKGGQGEGGEMYAQASSWTEEDMRRLAGAARAASDRRPDLAAARAMGGVVAPLVLGERVENGLRRSGERG